MREIRLLPNHPGISAAKRTLDRVGVILHGYDLGADAILRVHVEERDCDKACDALRLDGFDVQIEPLKKRHSRPKHRGTRAGAD